MTKTPDQSAIRAAVERRLARRHRAERRFQAYGIGAIALAVVFLVVLIGSIVLQAIPAFTQYTLTLPVTIEEELADPQGDRSEQSLRAGSYNRILQISLQDQFPSVSGRSELRELFGLYTAVNAATLLRQVVENPELVGQTIEFSMPISDDADLYLKGVTTRERFIGHAEPIELAIEGGDVTLTAQSAVFDPFLDVLREDIAAAAEAAEARARDAAARAEAAVTEDERAAAQAEAERARVEAEALRARLEEGAEIALGPQMASLMVRAGEGVVKVERIFDGGRAAEGTVLIAPGALTARPRPSRPLEPCLKAAPCAAPPFARGDHHTPAAPAAKPSHACSRTRARESPGAITARLEAKYLKLGALRSSLAERAVA